jgi:hypothetical protein
MMSSINNHFRTLLSENEHLFKQALIALEDQAILSPQSDNYLRARPYNSIPCYKCFKCLPPENFQNCDLPDWFRSYPDCSSPITWLRLCMACSLPGLQNGPTKIFYTKLEDREACSLECRLCCQECKMAKRIGRGSHGGRIDATEFFFSNWYATCYDCSMHLSSERCEELKGTSACHIDTRRGMDYTGEE